MWRYSAYACAMIGLIGLAACGAPAADNGGPSQDAPLPEGSGTYALSPEHEAGPRADSLAGSTWTIDGFTVTFKAPPDVFVTGGPLEQLAPQGATGAYQISGTIVEVNVLGQTKTGVWDGERLVMDGEEAVRIE